MANIHTVFTDDDGDGIYDDVHHVVGHTDNSYYQPNYTYQQPREYSQPSTGSYTSMPKIFSTKTKRRIIIGILVFLFVMGKLGPYIIR